jgi:hypothetical protein
MTDRALLNKILKVLDQSYPKQLQVSAFGPDLTDPDVLARHFAYLEENGLVQVVWSRTLMSGPEVIAAKITARGIDFLADDGGLSAILGVVTVKLHEEDIKALLLAKVEAATAEPSMKAELEDTIRKLPADALRSVVMRGVDGFLSNTPDLITSIRNLLP